MRVGVLVILVLFLVTTAWAEDLGSPITGEAKTIFLTTWGEHLRSMRSLHMLFRQEKQLRVLRQALVAQGELWLKGETLLYLLKNPAGETELIVRLDKQTVQTYYTLLNTLEVVNLQTTGAFPQVLPFWYPEPDALGRDYEVDLFLDAGGLHTLRLVPKDARVSVQEMRLMLRDFQPQAFEQVEKNGTRVHMQITTFTMNAEVSEAQLELHVPVGTKVVHPLK
jgi:outer membrane lipoprotein-sorting protein